MSQLDTNPYKGVRDFYPDDKARMTALFTIIRDTLGRYGYAEYDASPLERAELYESKTSEEIVSEQTYTFTDRGDRRVTLRPEMTPTLARMVAAKRRELPMPLRWYAIPNLFRYERPQKGRLREHYQVNVDLVGASGAEAEMEIIMVARDILHAFGASDELFSIRVNSRELLTAACTAAGLSEEEHGPYLRLLDKRAKMAREEFDTASAELLNDRPDPLSCIENVEDTHVAEAKGELIHTIETLKLRGISNIVYDPTLTRGFDYYTGLVFEIFDADPDNNRSMFGGGRYDNLIGMFSSESVPAVGFGMGDVTLLDFLDTHELLPEVDFAPHLYIATPREEDIPAAQVYAAQLRNAGLSIFVNLGTKKIGDQIKDAEKRGISHVIVYGEKEADGNIVTVRNIRTGDEEEVSKNAVLDVLELEI